MTNFTEKIRSVPVTTIIALVLIIVGLIIMVPRAMGMWSFYSEVRYATENNFQAGNISPDLLRPWMSLRYISVAFAVPQKFLFDFTKIQPRKETSMIAINRLNRQLNLGQVDGQPKLMKTIKTAILAYRANPVVTGLIEGHVEEWMNVAYIANSTGIPAATILNQAGIPTDGNSYKPLGFLSNEFHYSGGTRALVAAIQKIVDSQAATPVAP